ncbi:MAG: cytochrome c-type biogenesis protein [bacterium]
MTRVGGVLAFLAVGLSITAANGQTLDDRVQEVARELMCPVCEGQTVADSSVLLAVQMRVLIREKLAAGQTREEILAFFVARYGESILAAPPKRGVNLIVWAGPFVILALGFGFAARTLRRLTRPPSGRRKT